MKINKFAFIFLGAFSLHIHHVNALEEIVVTSSIIEKSVSNVADPVHILSGDEISTEATQSLGETIDELLGVTTCLLYTSPSPRDRQKSRMPSSA